MARINLLTVHWGCSYGGTMQTYATIELLKRLGHEVTLINLIHPKQKITSRKSTFFSWIIIELSFRIFRIIHFGKMTKSMYSINEKYIPDSDFTVVGSDQVWNSDITGPIQMSYFLDFEKKSRKISFASSFGKFQWEESKDVTDAVKTHLSKFSAISVREESGVVICKDVFGLNAVQVLDPTLVYVDYGNLIRNRKPIHRIYPFILKRSVVTDEICNVIAKEIGMKVYRSGKINSLIGVGPISWLNRMKRSDFIITDSFHGLAFSLIFHKQFIVLPCIDNRKFARLQSLLSLVNLSSRFVKSLDYLLSHLDLLHENIDYNAVDNILNSERNKSIAFLKKNIQ